MIYDWYCYNYDKDINKIYREDINDVRDCHAKLKLLTSLMIDQKDTVKEKHKLLVYGKRNDKSYKHIKSEYNTKLLPESLNTLKNLKLFKPEFDIEKYPYYSFFLQFKFKLATPFLSRDDDEFYICDNPIRKDKVFKVPMISGSSWKGNLRWTMGKIFNFEQNGQDAEISRKIIRLFGNEKTEEKEFRRGRLNFYPTFFDQIGIEVINPHNRKTRTGINPIYIESVPAGATGIFSILYVPFDLMGKKESEIIKAVSEDLKNVYNAVSEMMLTYGFSSKKTSGFGIVHNKIWEDFFRVRGIEKMTNKGTFPKQKQQNQQGIKLSNLKDLGRVLSDQESSDAITFEQLKKKIDSIRSILDGANPSGKQHE